MMKHLTEEDLILLYYAEPGASEAARAHLADCPDCQAASVSLARTLTLCNELEVPERPPGFERDVWNRLVPALDASTPAKGAWRSLKIWAAAAGFAILLLAVFMAGRLSRSATPPVMAGLSDQARERILAIAVADHLDRVDMLLTEISNTSGPNQEALASDRDRAADLVQEDRLLRQSLSARGQTNTTAFLDEVERFLIEAAHTPEGASIREVGELRDRIESGSLLFKVRIVESNLRNEEQKL